MTDSPDERDAALDQIRGEYTRRTERFDRLDERRRRIDAQLLERTMQSYGQIFERNGLLPLGDRAVLDVGSGRNEFLVACRERWGHTGTMLCGVDLMPDRVEKGLAEYPYLTLKCGSADRLDWPDASFDLVHQSMLLTSVLNDHLVAGIVAEMSRVTRPGGLMLWYDFVWNPTNRAARGISLGALRRHFAGWRLVDRRRITVAPPVARRLCRISPRWVDLAESLRVLNLWELVLLEKPRS